jgi:uncharacterized membrane protein YcgQ (UPF0703/DUF1980 family)
MFLHISEASSQDIKGFFNFLLSKLVYSQMWLNLLMDLITNVTISQNWNKKIELCTWTNNLLYKNIELTGYRIHNNKVSNNLFFLRQLSLSQSSHIMVYI